MGWLDNSTNNIILDAVLTDYGRQALARNDNSFKIAKFGLGDDEVNYGIITKYGRTIGREKIEKNTPVFEAFTNQNIALKYKLISSPIPLLYLPKFSLVGATSVALSSGVNGINTFRISIEQAMSTNAQSTIPSDFIETNFNVYIPDLFLTIANVNAVASDNNRISLYNLSTTTTSNGRPQLTFDLSLRSLANATFSVYSVTSASNKQTITTQIKIAGIQSGAVLEIPVTITKV